MQEQGFWEKSGSHSVGNNSKAYFETWGQGYNSLSAQRSLPNHNAALRTKNIKFRIRCSNLRSSI